VVNLMTPNGRILVADDQEHMRTLLQECFRNAGYEVDSVEDGLRLVDRLQSHPLPDLLILSLMGPGIDGPAVMEQLRQRHDTLPPVIVLTASPEEEGYRPAPEGASVVLSRPFTFPVLHGICEALVLANAVET
jgi:CheY-like chemotaxis protein